MTPRAERLAEGRWASARSLRLSRRYRSRKPFETAVRRVVRRVVRRAGAFGRSVPPHSRGSRFPRDLLSWIRATIRMSLGSFRDFVVDRSNVLLPRGWGIVPLADCEGELPGCGRERRTERARETSRLSFSRTLTIERTGGVQRRNDETMRARMFASARPARSLERGFLLAKGASRISRAITSDHSRDATTRSLPRRSVTYALRRTAHRRTSK